MINIFNLKVPLELKVKVIYFLPDVNMLKLSPIKAVPSLTIYLE